MEAQFRTPPDVAKPRVWWHWMNGNVAEAGITADLQWMNRVGIGGVHLLESRQGGRRGLWGQRPLDPLLSLS